MNTVSTSSRHGLFSRMRNEFGLLLAIIVVIAVTFFVGRVDPSIAYPNLARETALLGIFALGAGLVIIVGGIDLSAGAVIAFSGMVFCSVCLLLAPINPQSGAPDTANLPTWVMLLAFLVTMLSAVLIGSFHAWLITAIGLPPFVATLASLVGLRSLAKLLIQDVTRIAFQTPTGKSTIGINDPNFLWFAYSNWWPPVAIFCVLALLLWFLMSKTVVGRHLYAIGGNETAAKLSGIRTDRLKWLAYVISSVTAAIAGILYACYVGTVDPSRDGMGYELNAIAASVVGGCSLAGGVGSVFGIFLGSLFLKAVIDFVAKCFSSRPDLIEGLVVGMLVVLAVAFNEMRSRSATRKHYFSGALGPLNIVTLTMLVGAVVYATSIPETKSMNGIGAAIGTLIILVLRMVYERRSLR